MIMIKTQSVNLPFSLSGADNLRELGGYHTIDGNKTSQNCLLRSDGLQQLTEEDKFFLVQYGVRQIIDLRSLAEKKKSPYNFSAYPMVKVYHLPIFVDVTNLDGSLKMPETLPELYGAILDGAKVQLAQAVRIIGKLAEGCTLFHCAAGKDRTGILSMLLLQLAGVPDETIIAEYCSSCDNMAVKFQRQKLEMYLEGMQINEALFGSSPRDIVPTLEYLYARYGSAKDYFLEAGCKQQELTLIQRKLLKI